MDCAISVAGVLLHEHIRVSSMRPEFIWDFIGPRLRPWISNEFREKETRVSCWLSRMAVLHQKFG